MADDKEEKEAVELASAVKSKSDDEEGGDESGPSSDKFQLREESVALQKELIDTIKKHTKEGGPKVAIVQFFVNRIFGIDDVIQRCECDFYLKVNWIDPQYIGVSDDDFSADEKKEFWKPGVEVTNGIALEKLIDGDEAYWVEHPKYGVLAYTQRYIGTLNMPMDLHDFPFDMQIIKITFESFHWKADDLLLVGLERHRLQRSTTGMDGWSALSPQVYLPDWQVQLIEVKEILNYYKFEDRLYAQVEPNIYVIRKDGYYIQQTISLLGIVCAMCWVAFFFDVFDFGNRISFIITLFLALVAFQFVITTSLPKVPYATRVTKYLIFTYLMVVAVLIQAVFEHILEQFFDDPDLKGVAKTFDWTCLGIVVLIFFFFNCFYCCGVSRLKKRRLDELAKKQ